MGAVKKLAMIFLAIYLLVTGIATIGGVVLPGVANFIVQLLAILSGLFIFISLGTFTGKDEGHK